MFHKSRLAYMHLVYKFHLVVRLLHDKAYQNNRHYKRWTDNPYSDKVHKAIATGFVAVLLVLFSIQNIFPFLNPIRPSKVLAGANSKTWTTNGDFAYNKSTLCGATTASGVNISGAAYTDATCATAATDANLSLGKEFVPFTPAVVYYGGAQVYGGSGNIYAIAGNNTTNFYKYNIATTSWSAMASTPVNVTTGGALVYDGTNIFAFSGGTTNFYKYTISTNTWSTMAVSPASVSAGGALTYDGSGNIYAVTGNNTVGFYKYVISTNTWSAMANVPVIVNYGGAIAYDGSGSIFAFNGNRNTYFYKYTISANAWSSVAAAPAGTYTGSSLISNGSGNLYAFTGDNSTNFYKYVVATNTWSTLATAPAMTYTGAALSLDGAGNIFALTGGNTTGFYKYIISTNSWSIMGVTPSVVGNGGSQVYDGSGNIYTITGGNTSSFYKYKISTNVWSTLAGVPTAVSIGGALVYVGSDTIYSFSGNGSVNFYKYTISTNTWSTMASSLANVSSGGSLAYDGSGNIFAFTGGDVANLYKYTISSNSWSTLTAPPATVGSGGALVYGGSGNIYAFTGYDSTLGYDTGFHKYNIAANTWTTLNSAPSTVSLGSSFTYDGIGNIYATTGNALNGFYRYPISTGIWSSLMSAPVGFDSGGSISYDGVGGIYAFTGGLSNRFNKYFISKNMWTASPDKVVSPGSISGFKLDAGAGQKSSWASLTASQTIPANTSVVYETRSSNDNTTWSGWQATVSGAIQSPSARYLETRATLTSSDGSSTPIVNDFTATYDTLEIPTQANLTMQKTDGSTIYTASGNALLLGTYGGLGYTNETAIKVTANNLTCTGCATASTNLRPEVEIQPVGTAFTGTATATATPGNIYVIATGLTTGTGYHFQIRATDDQGRASAWLSYGGNAETEADFTVEQTSPTGTVSINSAATYTNNANVTLTLAASDTGGSALAQMRFSNDGTTWSAWEAYATTKTWALSAGEGTKTVYAQYKDWAGNTSGQISDSSFGGTLVGLKNSSNALTIGPQQSNLSGDANDGYIDDFGTGKIAHAVEPTALVGNDGFASTYAAYLRFTGLPSTNTGVANLNINVTDSQYITGVGVQKLASDYGTLDAGDSSVASASIRNQSLGLGWNSIDITTAFNASIAGNNGYFALRLVGFGDAVGGQLGISTYESGANKPYISYSALSGPPYATSGIYTSAILDSTISGARYGNLVATENKPTNTTITYQVRGGNTATPDASWTAYTTATNGSAIPTGVQGYRYLQYQATLSTTDTNVTPVLDDVFIGVNTVTSASITLDTVIPANVATPAAYQTSAKTLQFTDSSWYSTSTAYFEWAATTDPAPSAGIAGYKYCFDKVANNCNPTTQIVSANYTVSSFPLGDGMYSFKVIAVDNAGNVSATPTVFTLGRDATAPLAMSGISASQDDPTNINIGWTAYNDGNSPVINYQIQRMKKTEYDGTPATFQPTTDWSSAVSYTSITCGAVTAMVEDNVGVKTIGCSMDVGTAISQAYSYVYRVRAKDAANTTSWGAWPATVVIGMNADTLPPTNPNNLVATPDVSGYAIHLTWGASTDSGSGLSRYFIWRRAENNSTAIVDKTTGALVSDPTTKVWTLVGVFVPPVGAPQPQWDDNDANNDATNADKTVPSLRLNDYVNYYYRITAIDTTGNRTEIVTTDSGTGFPNNINYVSALTPDVTAPQSPTNVVATPLGADGVNVEPNNQQIDITWAAPADNRTAGRVPAGSGSGVAQYKIYRASGTISGPTVAFALLATRTVAQGLSYSDKGLAEDTYYYYKIEAIDVAGKVSLLSGQNPPSQTKNSQVPTTPTSVLIQATKGDPALNANVGKEITVSFNGSAIKFSRNTITGYEVYRSTTNFADDASWLAATKVQVYAGLNVPGYDATITYDQRRQFTDTVPTDATTYYYRVRAIANNATSGQVISSLSAVSVGILNAGWDVTPDTTAPSAPPLVSVKDTFPNNVYVRNLVTWQIPAVPTRKKLSYETCTEVTPGYCNKFARYEVWREMTNPNSPTTPAVVTKIYETTNFYDNQRTDNIDISLQNFRFDYYVVTVDNSGTDFKYNNSAATPINSYSNTSAKRYAADSIIPSETTPRLVAGSQVVLNAVNVSSAVIEWDTNQRADSLVEYRLQGSSDAYIAVGDRDPVMHHSVKIFDLRTDTPYEYRVVSRNKLGNDMVIDVASYLANYGQTLPALRTARFAIVIPANDADFKTSTTSTVQFNWTTTKDAKTNYIEYEAAADPNNPQLRGIAGQLATSSGYNLTSHSVILKGLRSKTKYRFKIKGISTDNYQAEAPEGANNYYYFETTSFDTAQFTLAPSSSNVAERNITATTAQIAWETANLSTSWVDYGTTTGVLNTSAGNDEFVRQHLVKIEGLVPGTKYYYKVRVVDEFGNVYTSQEYGFTAVLKPKIANLRVADVTPYKVTLSWETNVETETIINWGKTASYGEKRGKSGVGRAHELVIDNLDDNQEYHYQILAKDAAGNEVADEDKIVRTPLDTEGPKISNVKIDVLPMGENDTTSSVIVSWQTNKPATTLVEYDEGVIGGTYSKRSVEDSSLNNSHTVIVKDLQPASSYHYRLVSKDKRSNKTISQDYTFVTPSKEKSILQLILKSLEETFAWTRNLNQFFGNIGKRLTGK